MSGLGCFSSLSDPARQSALGSVVIWRSQKHSDKLAETGCVDLAVSRDDERAVVETFTDEELTAVFYLLWQGWPVSIVKVNRQLKELYRGLKRRTLAGTAGSTLVLLDNICVNIRLLSADKLSALCGSPGQYELPLVSRLKEKASSVVQLEDILMNDGDDRIQTSGIAGSGKSTAFMEKASHEWAKVNKPRSRRPFWQNIALFFKGQLDHSEMVEGTGFNGDFWDRLVLSYKRGGRQGGEIHQVALATSSARC